MSIKGVVLFFAFLQGCTFVRVTGADANVSQGIGFVRVNVQSDSSLPVVVTTRGVGVIGSARSVTLGFVSEFVALFPDPSACHTLIVVEKNDEFNYLKSLFINNPKKLNNLCLTSKDGEVWHQLAE